MNEIIRQRVHGPGLALVVTAGIGVLVQAVRVVGKLLGFSMMVYENPDYALSMPIEIGIGVVLVALGAFIAYGGMQMRELRSWGLCVAASVVALIPCTSPCCVLTLPVGIWALVVLMKPEVKAAFTS